MTRDHRNAFIVIPWFLLFFGPYLFDLAYCEELSDTPVSHAALIAGESDVSEGEGSWPFDVALTRPLHLAAPSLSAWLSDGYLRYLSVAALLMRASRAPPFAPPHHG